MTLLLKTFTIKSVDRPLCCQLLLISINRRLSSPSSPISNDSDSAIDEWMHLFALRILQNDRGKELFDLVGGKGEPSTFAALTHEQVW